MLVKIGNTVFGSAKEPIVLLFESTEEKERCAKILADMVETNTDFLGFHPESVSEADMHKFVTDTADLKTSEEIEPSRLNYHFVTGAGVFATSIIFGVSLYLLVFSGFNSLLLLLSLASLVMAASFHTIITYLRNLS